MSTNKVDQYIRKPDHDASVDVGYTSDTRLRQMCVGLNVAIWLYSPITLGELAITRGTQWLMGKGHGLQSWTV